MVDLSSSSGSPSFSAGGHQRSKKGLQARDIIALLMVIVSLMLVIALIVWIDQEANRDRIIDDNKSVIELPPMSVPQLEEAPDLPSREDIALWEENIQWVNKNPHELAKQYNGFSSMSFAWLRRQMEADRKDPPLPQFYNVEDILIEGLTFGTPTIVEGRIANARTVTVEGFESWQWLTLEAGDDHFLMILAPADQRHFTIGNQASIVGRSMGLMKNPGVDGEWIPLIGARSIHERTASDDQQDTRLPGVMSDTPELGKNTEEEQELFAHINDVDPLLELRPYFYLIGKIAKIDSYDEHVYDNAQSANDMAGAIHDNPSAYRGQTFAIEGHVIDVFRDEIVEKRRPYDIDNVTRVIVWTIVREQYKITDLTGNVKETVEPVRHTFELAVVGDLPPLERGQQIRASGRFLKVHGIPMEPSTNRDELYGQLQSDNFYSKMFVVPDIEIIEEEKQPLWVKLSITIVLCSFFCCVLWLYLKDIRHSEKVRTRPRRRMRRVNKETADPAEQGSTEES